ncbi:hypothetical protein ACLB1G_26480 [Oxalobacteraceae bacterium A2-2]
MFSKRTHRPDFASSEVVETGISLADRLGIASAVAYLSGRGIPERIIARVLTAPWRRRNPGRLRSREEHLCEEASRFKFLL